VAGPMRVGLEATEVNGDAHDEGPRATAAAVTCTPPLAYPWRCFISPHLAIYAAVSIGFVICGHDRRIDEGQRPVSQRIPMLPSGFFATTDYYFGTDNSAVGSGHPARAAPRSRHGQSVWQRIGERQP